MSVRIGHAVGDEHGNARGGQPGDQTGKEVRIQDWYKRSGGWDAVLVCKSEKLAAAAALIMTQICEDDSFGYDQDDRWTAYKAIRVDGISGASDSEVDCSSLVLICYILAGLDHKASGYTGSMRKTLMATGMFEEYSDLKHLNSPDYVPKGSIYLDEGKHVVMTLDDGRYAKTETDIDEEYGVDTESGTVEFTDSSYVLVDKINNWGNIRDNPDGEIIGKCYKNDKFKCIDYDGTWYMILYNTIEAFIHQDLCTFHEEGFEDGNDSDDSGKRMVRVVSEQASVRKVPKTGKRVYIAKRGETFEILGTAANGFYLVDTPKGEGYISFKPKYTEVLTE